MARRLGGDPVFDRSRRSWLFRTRVRDEVDGELAFHLEMRTRHYTALGLSPDEAQTRARAEFGDVEGVRRACRALGYQRDDRLRRAQYLDELRQDLRFAVRQLRAAPGFAAVALLTLALGIGATTVIYSLARGVLLAPLPYADADRLVVAHLSLPDYHDLREAAGGVVFSDMAVWARNLDTLTGGGESEQVLSGQVSPEFFQVLGVAPLLGRTLTAEDGASPVVVLSYGLWQRRFGGDAAIAGRTIEIGRRQFTVIGVMPASFAYPGRECAMWLPLARVMAEAREQAENRSLRIFRLLARLEPSATRASAQARASALAAELARRYPDANQGIDLELRGLRESLVGNARRPLVLLLSAVALLLAIACVNVANLLLARASTRDREVAVRTALGAGRARLVRQMLTESVLLALVGGALGLVLARAAFGSLLRFLDALVPRADALVIDLGAAGFATAVALVAGVLFGLVPACLGTSASGRVALGEAGRGQTGQRRGRRVRGVLIGVEVALAVVVLVSASLLGRSLLAVTRADLGFEPQRLLTLNVVLAVKPGGVERAAAARAVIDRLQALPRVEAVGAATGLPAVTAQRGTRFEIEGAVSAAERPSAYFVAATPGYFRALGTAVRQGRAFESQDRAGATPVAILNETLARRLFPGQSPLGQRLRLVNPEQSDVWRTIVGVVTDVRYSGLEDPGDAAVYTPFDQTPFLWMYVFVRTHGEPQALARDVGRAIAEVAPDITPAQFKPMRLLVHEAIEGRVVNAAILGAFAASALLLAAIGIAGLVAYAVAQRRGELALRLALGAAPAGLVRLVMEQGMAPVGLGALAGLGAAWVSARLLESLLYEVTAQDPVTFLAAGALVAVTAGIAAWIPARRTSRIEPVEALRAG